MTPKFDSQKTNLRDKPPLVAHAINCKVENFQSRATPELPKKTIKRPIQSSPQKLLRKNFSCKLLATRLADKTQRTIARQNRIRRLLPYVP